MQVKGEESPDRVGVPPTPSTSPSAFPFTGCGWRGGEGNQSERDVVAAFWIVPPVTLGTQNTHAHTWLILGSSDARFPSKYIQGSRCGCMTRCSFCSLCQHPLKSSSSQEGALSLLDTWAPHLLIPLKTLCLHRRPSEIPAPRQSSQSAATHPIWGSAPTCSSLS